MRDLGGIATLMVEAETPVRAAAKCGRAECGGAMRSGAMVVEAEAPARAAPFVGEKRNADDRSDGGEDPLVSQGQTMDSRRQRQMGPRTTSGTMVLFMVDPRLVGRRRRLHEAWQIYPRLPEDQSRCAIQQTVHRPRLVP